MMSFVSPGSSQLSMKPGEKGRGENSVREGRKFAKGQVWDWRSLLLCHEPIQDRLGCRPWEPLILSVFLFPWSAISSGSSTYTPSEQTACWLWVPPLGLSCASPAFFSPSSSHAPCWTPGSLHPDCAHKGSQSSLSLFSCHQDASPGNRALSFTRMSLYQNGSWNLKSPDHDC